MRELLFNKSASMFSTTQEPNQPAKKPMLATRHVWSGDLPDMSPPATAAHQISSPIKTESRQEFIIASLVPDCLRPELADGFHGLACVHLVGISAAWRHKALAASKKH